MRKHEVLIEDDDNIQESQYRKDIDRLRWLRIAVVVLVMIGAGAGVTYLILTNQAVPVVPATTGSPTHTTTEEPLPPIVLYLGNLSFTFTPNFNFSEFNLSLLFTNNVSNGDVIHTHQLRCSQLVYLKYPSDNFFLSGGDPDTKLSVSFTVKTEDQPKFVSNLQISEVPRGKTSSSCYLIEWQSWQIPAEETLFEDCYELGDSPVWYGAVELPDQQYDLRQWNRSSEPFLPRDAFSGQWGGVLERYFLSWNGFAIYVDWQTPLFVSVKDNQLCLRGQITAPYKLDATFLPKNALNYYVCQGPDVATVHQEIVSRFFKKPSATPEPMVLRDPIWSTWARYKDNITQKTVLDFATEITSHGFPVSNLEIDDSWTAKYGDLQFDMARFPNATEMVRQLHGMGASVTLWVHPFANVDSHSFISAIDQGRMYWLMNADDRKAPQIIEWWRGTGAVLDPSNPVATKWFIETLQNLTDIGIDGFKFDAGETQSLGSFAAVNGSLAIFPWQFTQLYATMAASTPGAKRSEVRVGCNTQDLPLLVRMMDRLSDWSEMGGLKSIIPTALTFSMAGYTFVLPDMIGGNVYCNSSIDCTGVLPDRELYIRWMELTAFLPAMQFSIAPWSFDEEVTNISLEFTQLHASFVTPRVLKAANQSIEDGLPIVRPLWSLCPTDLSCSSISDQFLIGDDLLVAPILNANQTRRDIFLPMGTWHDYLLNTNHQSNGTWLQNYTISLTQIAHFTKMN